MVVEQCGDLRVGDENDVAAVAAVATVRAGERLELFTTDGNTPVTAVTSAEVNRYFIDKRDHGSSFPS
ncbi:unannotated protein [freshwater metagenome]|uniref:Unannotated protein n=1 Tax=freshwater metagenome TaxID=449393 RepID=A0A6J6GCN5_9ZZZZ